MKTQVLFLQLPLDIQLQLAFHRWLERQPRGKLERPHRAVCVLHCSTTEEHFLSGPHKGTRVCTQTRFILMGFQSCERTEAVIVLALPSVIKRRAVNLSL